MEHLVIGTAGHVDHGKTTLIKALTGMETDTTSEEKKRGLSINLGFAYLDLPSGKRAGIVDVPGHEKFIKNMIAGVAGLNLVLLVIDGTEGVMPQTKEHVAILQLLGVTDFIIVLTKSSLMDDELRLLVEEDIREQFADTPLAQAPIFSVDSLEGSGLSELVQGIDELSQTVQQKNTGNLPRLHVDRVFSVKGFGTVVTGTLIEGSLVVNDEVMIYPQGIKSKIRNIQVHETNVEQATAGMRTALNLANVKVEELSRGDLIAVTDTLEQSWMLDVKVTVLPKAQAGIKLWDRLRLYLGTREVFCRVVPIGKEMIEPGEEGFLQLRLEEAVVAQNGDRFILRRYSPLETIGGGGILDVTPKKHRRFDEATIEALETREKGSLEEVVAEFMSHRQAYLTSSQDVANYLVMEETQVQELLLNMVAKGKIDQLGEDFLHPKQYQIFWQQVATTLERYHKSYRLRQGMSKEELRSKVAPELKARTFDGLLARLVADHYIKQTETISLADFKVTYNKYQLKDKAEIEGKLKVAGFTPPSQAELVAGKAERKELIDSLVGESVIRLDHENVIHRDFYEAAIAKSRAYIEENGKMTLGEFRDLTGSSRRYSMLILECLDKNNITKRVENYRVLA